ncbi:MAG: dTMP kinase [Phycisphaerae bacterium]|nr:dTMP kinase [Phycisphaerae bacterium]
MTLKEKLAGKFIVFDGPDGSGKGTQLRLLAEELRRQGAEVVLGKDPGGSEIGDRIRAILLRHDLSLMDVRCETMLFMASRAQLVGEVIEPALKAGKIVLCDRFISATCAYQGAAGYDIQRIIKLGSFAVGDTWPHLTVVVDIPVEEGFRRTGRNPSGAPRRRTDANQGLLLADIEPDAMEIRPIAFHRKVRKLFLELPPEYPGKVVVIDGSGAQSDVHRQVMETIERVDF